jgi:hypothetical protein
VIPSQVLTVGPLLVQSVQVFFQKANANVAVSHQLGVNPIGWVVTWKDKFSDIKAGMMPAGKSGLTLVSDTDIVNAVVMVIGLGKLRA